MNTTQLKKFAAEARTILKEGVILRLNALGFNHDGSVADVDRPTKGQGYILFHGEALPDDGFFERWQSLYDRVQLKGIQEVYEEAAYTWFNRLMAIRIMAKNGFIAPVLEYVSASTRIPVILSQAREGQFPEMSAAEREQLMAIIDDGRRSQEQFAILITAYCHANPVINKCFGGVTDYTTLLLPQNIIAEGGFIDLLNNTPFIEDADYRSAELIGWLYQFYISEKKDDVFASFKAGKKAEAEDIPAATQIFTPNWIVKYMVQNTLGRIYLDNNPYDTEIKAQMKYLVEPSEPTPEDAIFRYDSLEDLRLGDLACGSGHILNEFFDLLYLIYIEEGYSRRSTIENIFLKNLTGIDLDTRAKQLAQFALLVKACQKDQSFLDAAVMPNVLDMPIPLDMNMVKQTLPEFFLGGNQLMLQEAEDAFTLLQQAENLGSIMKFNISDSTRAAIEIRMKEWEAQPIETVPESIRSMTQSFRLILALTKKYSALCMNPPYMVNGNMNSSLSEYVKLNYDEGKSDLFSVFMVLAKERLSNNGKYGMINMHSWLFLSTFKNIRECIISNQNIDNLLHLGPHTFDELSGEVVQNVAFVITNSPCYKNGSYYRLVNGKNSKQKELQFTEAINNRTENIAYLNIDQNIFKNISGSPIIFHISKTLLSVFTENPTLGSLYKTITGSSTGDNGRFLRLWHEINISKIGFGLDANYTGYGYKWIPCSKGGTFRRWYGNLYNLINWDRDGEELKAFATYKNGGKHWSRFLKSLDCFYKSGLTWAKVLSGKFSTRYMPNGCIMESAGCAIMPEKEDEMYLLGLMNTHFVQDVLDMINPTLGMQTGDIMSIPIKTSPEHKSIITEISKDCLEISKQDWDALETSWDFKTNELVAINENNYLDIVNDYADFKGIYIDPAAPKPEKLEWHYNMYKTKWETLFYRLKQNEEELNRQFIEIYGLQDELEEFVRADEVTILQQGEIDVIPEPGDDSGYGDAIRFNADVVIKQFVSYAIGCWMGRYRLDKPGLHIAHPDAKPEEICSYEYNGQQFEIDDDGIIPLLPAYASFPDNGFKRIVDFVRIAFGSEHLTENINFIEEALGMTLEKFMVKEFWKYHKKMYQNRPIYWLFSSKKGAFQCITYMHRMTAYTVEQIRSKYLLPHIDWLKTHIAEMEARASQLSTQERRLKEQMAKDLKECLEYHDELHVVADHNVSFDLDDGVVKNYAKFGNVLAKLK